MSKKPSEQQQPKKPPAPPVDVDHQLSDYTIKMIVPNAPKKQKKGK